MGVWKDTLVVRSGRTYQVLTRYERYLGEFVLHCHILDHEDAGTMRGVRVANAQYEIGTNLARPYLVPLWTLPDGDGTGRKLADLMGKGFTVVAFLETLECATCNAQIREYVRRAAEFPNDVKVVFEPPGDRPAGSPTLPSF